MPIQYTAGPRVNTTAVCATKTDILNLIEAQLPLAGWTLVSGGGTANRLFQTATTTQGLALRCRAKDNGGTCIQLSIESTDGTRVGTNTTTSGASLIPGFTYRIVANPFQFACYSPSNYASSRMWAFVCCPNIPAPVVVPARAGFLLSDGQSDSNATQLTSLRTSLNTQANGNVAAPNQQLLWSGTIWEIANQSVGNLTCFSMFQLVMMQAVGNSGATMTVPTTPLLHRWANGDQVTSDALAAWGATALGDEPQIRAQIWDALIISDQYAGDTVAAFDGKNWITPTNNNVGQLNFNTGTGPRGSLFLVTP